MVAKLVRNLFSFSLCRGSRQRQGVIAFALLVVSLACSGSRDAIVIAPIAGTATNTRFAYIANKDDDTVSIFVFDSELGQLRHYGYELVGNEPVSVVADAFGAFVYVANFLDDTLSAFRIDQSNGQLSAVVDSPFATGVGPTAIATTPAGTFAFVTNATDATLTSFVVDRDTGVLAEAPNSPSMTGANPSSVAVHSSGNFVYTANTDGNSVSGFSIDQETGELTEVPGSPFVTGFSPSSIALNASGSAVYTTNFISNNISGFAVNANGSLSPLAGSPFKDNFGSPFAQGPSSLTIHPSGNFAYVVNFTSDDISVFGIAANGALAELNVQPFATGTDPVQATIDLNARSLFVVNSDGDLVTEYTIASNGDLLFDRDVVTRPGPVSITMTGAGNAAKFVPNFAYVANNTSDSLSCYSIDSTTGALTDLGETVSVADAFEVAVDPFGKFVFVTRNDGSGSLGNLAVFGIEDDGKLSEIIAAPLGTVGSPYATTPQPIGVAVDPSGRFIYVLCDDSGEPFVDVFSLDRDTGLLSRDQSNDVGADNSAGITVEPTGQFLYVAVTFTDEIFERRIDKSTGLLTGTEIFGAVDPVGLASDPTGSRVWTELTVDRVFGLPINPGGGNLVSPFDSVTIPISDSRSLFAEPSGRFLFAVSPTSFSIARLRIDSETRLLSSLGATSSFSVNNTVTGDVSGRFIYVVGSGVSTVSQFSLDTTSGVLSSIAPGTVSTETDPQGMATTGFIQ
ncbi:MAG: 6-phosphogluconolactonase (cycloisomerase 2 family) [Planctomycetota bacterium]|jgi:6-phosphogluconolactonase (cycloisomerase 2 family)